MNILDIPFHKFLNFKKYSVDEFIFIAEEKPEYLNHLNNIHACVQLSLAEASSGEFLLNQFFELRNELIPVIRKTEARYHKPANGSLYSKASFDSVSKETVLNDLVQKNRVIVKVKTEIFDGQNNKSLTATFEWFITKKTL
jgi:hypothetical protein